MPVRQHACRALLLLAAAAPFATAKDVFLTIGGGYNRHGNQVSLERNVLFQRQVLAEAVAGSPLPETYFASGGSGDPDLQYRDPDFETNCPRARRLMAKLFGDEQEVSLRYRPTKLTSVAGPADKKLLRRRLRKLADGLEAGDRLIVYFTGHGGGAEEPDEYEYYDEETGDYREPDPDAYNEHDTVMYLWDDDEVTASEFAAELDRLPEGVSVVMVMVQCFSGGFAHTIFHGADAELGLAKHTRAGFFSQRHDRYAAGCTPDINEADYQEYSTFFWAALGGRTRAGEPIGERGLGADYDRSGAVSFAEAHAYAVIESDTIDIPIRTSGALLRKYSTLGRGGDDDAEDAGDKPRSAIGSLFGMLGGGKKGEESKEAPAEVIRLEGPLSELAERGRPDQRAVIQRLAETVGLDGEATFDELEERLEELGQEELAVAGKWRIAERALERTGRRLRDRLIEKWPELDTPYSPVVAELCSERADEFVAAVDSMPALQAYRRASRRSDEAFDAYEQAEHAKAKAERLIRTCENIVLVTNLPLVAPAEIAGRYEQLLAAEEATLDFKAADSDESSESDSAEPPTANAESEQQAVSAEAAATAAE
ncbi:MAG: hypothetical protein AAGJ46_18355 [Planctomycetota bacterium]